MLHLRLPCPLGAGDIPQPVSDYEHCIESCAGPPNRVQKDGGKLMPEVPAQELLSLAKNSTGNQTERMATPEELYALKRIAEVESALAELAKAENSARENDVIATEIPVQVALPEPEHSAVTIAEAAAVIAASAHSKSLSLTKSAGKLELAEENLATSRTQRTRACLRSA